MTVAEAKEQAKEIVTNGITRTAFRGMKNRQKAFDLFNEVYHYSPDKHGVGKEKFAEMNGCKSCNRRVVDGLRRYAND